MKLPITRMPLIAVLLALLLVGCGGGGGGTSSNTNPTIVGRWLVRSVTANFGGATRTTNCPGSIDVLGTAVSCSASDIVEFRADNTVTGNSALFTGGNAGGTYTYNPTTKVLVITPSSSSATLGLTIVAGTTITADISGDNQTLTVNTIAEGITGNLVLARQ